MVFAPLSGSVSRVTPSRSSAKHVLVRQYKRAVLTFFAVEDDELLDIASLMRGECRILESSRLVVFSPVTASKYVVTVGDLGILLRVPANRWTAEEEILEVGTDRQQLEAMARKGLLLSDSSDPMLMELRRRAEILAAEQWHPYAAFYHFMTRTAELEGMDEPMDYAAIEARASERASRYVAEHGPPPPVFRSHPTEPEVPNLELPMVEKTGELYEILKRRKTTRGFDLNYGMRLGDLSTLLYYTFGCHGYTFLSPEVPLIHRTSPSGGSRHPVEVYTLILRVEGIETGLYHYDVQNHSLESIKSYDMKTAQELAVQFAAGQTYSDSAHVLFIMTAVYFRNFWKYRKRSRAYSVILMDSAHLSQTLYLVATDLGLGMFFSAAIDNRKIEDEIGIDPYREGAIAICGCGVKAATAEASYSLNFKPFVPRKTTL